MADSRTPAQRRKIMQSVGTKNTGPELKVRRLLHKLGYRYRLHVKELPGKPDVVFPARRLALFIHGCYWHGHGCSKGRLPKSRLDYWMPKIRQNQARDAANRSALQGMGWRAVTLWQCQLGDDASLVTVLAKELGSPKNRSTSPLSKSKIASRAKQHAQ